MAEIGKTDPTSKASRAADVAGAVKSVAKAMVATGDGRQGELRRAAASTSLLFDHLGAIDCTSLE